MAMAASTSLRISITLQCTRNNAFFVDRPFSRTNLPFPRHRSSSSLLTFARRRSKPHRPATTSSNKKKQKPVRLRNWQLKRLAYALKDGRRKTSIKNLAADVCLDRAVVLELLRDPPPHLLLLSAALPDKPISTISEPPSIPLETVPLEEATDDAETKTTVEMPVHVRQRNWAAKKRIKKKQLETLELVYRRSQRPTNAMISSIVHVTNLPHKRVVKWFEDKRAEDGVPDNHIPKLPYRRSAAPETSPS
nr:protein OVEREXPRESSOR OF CATIONIC PEROXIDASE 3 [Ipomoea batatas]